MKPLKWLWRVVVIGFLVGLLSTSALKMPRIGLWQRFTARLGLGRDPFRKDYGAPIVWSNFGEAVSDKQLRKLDAGFLAECQPALDRITRQGQKDLGVKNPQTAGQHVENLRMLAQQYGPAKGFSVRDLLELELMFPCHELSEIFRLDVPRFRLPARRSEQWAHIRNFEVPSPQKERARLKAEWRKERPFIILAVTGLVDPVERRIVVYLYDRFYCSADPLARFARDLHYLEPALDIRRRTRSVLARRWHYDVAAAFIRDGLLRQVLDRAYRVGVKEPAGQECLAPEA